MNEHHPATLLAQADHFLDEETGAVTPPIYNSSTFARNEHYEIRARGAVYSRYHNPTSEPAERLLAKLEGGAQALLFGSGLARIIHHGHRQEGRNPVKSLENNNLQENQPRSPQ